MSAPDLDRSGMRIAHATDIHWFTPPSLRDFAPKRVIGTLNLYARGRRHMFADTVQSQLVAHIQSLEPDLVLITGDLTAQALPSEFAKARDALAPLLTSHASLVLPGNHDVYTPGSVRHGLFAQTFAAWSGVPDPAGSGLVRVDVGNLTAIGLDPNRPTWITAAGKVPRAQLARLAALLADPELADRHVVLGIHYPIVDHTGALYDEPTHGLLNAQALVDVLDQAPKRPLFVACGHVHRGFLAPLVLSDGARVPIVDCGSSGHSYAERRHASMGLYDIDDDGQVTFRRHVHDGERFVPEVGGPFAAAVEAQPVA
ncbi:MAG: metallophosphoesterase [Myxococcota bacterium]